MRRLQPDRDIVILRIAQLHQKRVPEGQPLYVGRKDEGTMGTILQFRRRAPKASAPRRMRSDWRRRMQEAERARMREADQSLGEPPFGRGQAVGWPLLRDPWIAAALEALGAQLPALPPPRLAGSAWHA